MLIETELVQNVPTPAHSHSQRVRNRYLVPSFFLLHPGAEVIPWGQGKMLTVVMNLKPSAPNLDDIAGCTAHKVKMLRGAGAQTHRTLSPQD